MTAIEFNHQLLQLQNPLKYFALSLTSDNEAANDLLQETMYRALKYKDKFVEKTNLKAWLYTIMKNTFINNYRKQKRVKTFVDQTEENYYINIPGNSGFDSPESSYAATELKSQIEGLHDDYRIAFEKHLEGYKYKEIAEELDIPIGTVKSRIHMARQKLMEELKEYIRQ